MWTKYISNGEWEYLCECGMGMIDEFYNADTGHYECPGCGSESPDLENIETTTWSRVAVHSHTRYQ